MEKKNINIALTIPEELQNNRLDQAVSTLLPEYSRERLKNWIKSGQCLVDGKKMKPRDKVLGKEEIIINAELELEVKWKAEDIDLDIVYEDDDILIVNKPANLVVHPGAGNYSGTLVNGLLNYLPNLDNIPRAGIVHRIDKDTTGLLMVAKTLESHTSLINQLQERTIDREYEAIVHGVFLAGGTIKAKIGRHHTDRKKMAVSSNGKDAVTHYRVLEKFNKFTYIKVKLETGRTHQIRVHMSHLKHPLVGDKVYSRLMQLPAGHVFTRQALHAKTLGLIHPKTGEYMQWESELPEDMKELLFAISNN